MNGIKEYLIALVGACTIGAIADLVTSSFSEKYPGLDKSVRLGITVCVLAVVLLPLFGGGKDDEITMWEGFHDTEAVFSEYDRSSFLEKEVQEETKRYIFEKTGIRITDAAINIEIKDDTTVEITEAEITVSSLYYEQRDKISAAALEALGREAIIIYVD